KMVNEQFTSFTTAGGTTQILARSGTVTGQATLSVAVRKRLNDPGSTGLPADPGALFGGPAGPDARKPDLVYPNAGVLGPPNLAQVGVHCLRGAQNTLFELSFANRLTDVKVYLKCAQPLGGGCIYKPDSAVWIALAWTNRGADPVTVSLRGTDAAGAAVGAS